jgi:hypothetical protein
MKPGTVNNPCIVYCSCGLPLYYWHNDSGIWYQHGEALEHRRFFDLWDLTLTDGAFISPARGGSIFSPVRAWMDSIHEYEAGSRLAGRGK